MRKVLVTGALGQIGSELTAELRRICGPRNVIATSRRGPPETEISDGCRFELLDVTHREAVNRAFARHEVDTVFHLAAILSATGEQDPQLAWTVNIEGLRNVLGAAHAHGVKQVFWPSSIAAFGPDTPREHTPQLTVMRPNTMYGITKAAGELLCDYYAQRYGLDVRGVRYPGVISSATMPGGGTTDYAVEMFYAALRHERYRCFVSAGTMLPMIYMPDCIKAAIDLMFADRSSLRHANAYNLAAMSVCAMALVDEIRKHVPGFECTFEPDYRQQIADAWPRSIDDSAARADWHWRPKFDLAATAADMMERLKAKQRAGQL
ncbi:MAG: NAD-dependent epimerase/dehydratase family protein [Gammaproteobacteria bacterium]